jgi:hypothetical protein
MRDENNPLLLLSSSSSLTRHGGLRNLQTMRAQMGQKDDGL